jgi:glycosyltransferase involved in cell wall biosynthesis
MIYDIIPLRCPHLCAPYLWELMNGWVPAVLACSDVAVTISEHSRRDLEDYGRGRGLEMPPVEVIRLGDEPGDDDRESPPAGLADGEPFALYVSTVGLHKNHQLLFHVWRRLIDRHGERVPKMVLVGGHGWRKETVLEDMRSDPELSRRVVTLAADDHQLRWLYRRCLFTVYPSHYEGWGLPVAEGMALGKFCVCSSAASLPEVGGDLACYHDPLDGPGCLALVERAILEPGWLAAREERVRREYRTTTWRDTARQTFDLLDQHFRLEEKMTATARLLHAA